MNQPPIHDREPSRVLSRPMGRGRAEPGAGPPSWNPCDQRTWNPRNWSASPSADGRQALATVAGAKTRTPPSSPPFSSIW